MFRKWYEMWISKLNVLPRCHLSYLPYVHTTDNVERGEEPSVKSYKTFSTEKKTGSWWPFVHLKNLFCYCCWTWKIFKGWWIFRIVRKTTDFSVTRMKKKESFKFLNIILLMIWGTDDDKGNEYHPRYKLKSSFISSCYPIFLQHHHHQLPNFP